MFVRSTVQLSAKAAALVARQVDGWCSSFSRATMRFQARLCGKLAAAAACQGALIAMEVAGGAAVSVAVAVAVEAAAAVQAALQRMGVALAPLVAKAHVRHRRRRLRLWCQHQRQVVTAGKQLVLSTTVEGVGEGCILLGCPAGSRCVDVTLCMDWVNHYVRALRPTEASSTSENLNKRPKS